MVFLFLVVVLGVVINLIKRPSESSHIPSDYRCNGDARIDAPSHWNELGRADRYCNYAEGDAYKMDSPRNNGVDY